MTTNTAILTALNEILANAALSYPISWPGINFNFTPPDNGEWLEVRFLPNRGIDQWIANDSDVSPQGIYQIDVYSRPQSELKFQTAIDSVSALYPKGTKLADNVRVSKPPYSSVLDIQSDRMSVSISIEYSE
jgi:hypothetical protein